MSALSLSNCKIGVVGLGYVGLPLAVEFGKKFRTVGFDIKATRVAWGIDSVVTRDLTGDIALTLKDIRANGPTIENVRLWDREPLLQTFGQLQEIRTYYDFVNVDDDRYVIEGRYRQILLSARELNTTSIPARTFINDHLSYTHGMGVTLAPVNMLTTEGLPVLFVKDLPPVSTVALNVTRPQIYFGELTNDYAIVGTKQPEFDHPSGDSTVYASYQGQAGVPLTFMRRAILAWHFGSMRMLLSGDLTAQSKILYNRNIVRRAERAARGQLRAPRSPLPREVHARDRQLSPLQNRRCVVGEGARGSLVSRGLFGATEQTCDASRARRHPRIHRRAPLLP